MLARQRRRKVRRSSKRPGYEEKFKKFKIDAAIGRAVDNHGDYVFEACVRAGRNNGGPYNCAKGKNPRKALAAALKSYAQRIGRQKGAFAGRK
jgi:hypothetical protein